MFSEGNDSNIFFRLRCWLLVVAVRGFIWRAPSFWKAAPIVTLEGFEINFLFSPQYISRLASCTYPYNWLQWLLRVSLLTYSRLAKRCPLTRSFFFVVVVREAVNQHFVLHRLGINKAIRDIFYWCHHTFDRHIGSCILRVSMRLLGRPSQHGQRGWTACP